MEGGIFEVFEPAKKPSYVPIKQGGKDLREILKSGSDFTGFEDSEEEEDKCDHPVRLKF